MTAGRFRQSNHWQIMVTSESSLSDGDRELIVAFFNEIAWRRRDAEIILHDVIESRRFSQLFVEADKSALAYLISELRENLDYRITFHRFPVSSPLRL